MNKVYGYVYSFLSFLTHGIEKEIVNRIVLFGSLTREEMNEESDIDLFIELYDLDKKEAIRKQVNSALEDFKKSDVYKQWNLRGVENEINCLVGSLSEQSDLKRSLISNGIILYGSYTETIGGKNYTLFKVDTISEKNKRYRVFRKLFGRKEKERRTKGLVKELGGKQISTRTFLIPIKQTSKVLKLLKEENVEYFMMEVSTDEEI